MGATADALRDAWGGEELPATLVALSDRQDSAGAVVCDFELSPRAQGQVAAALGIDEAAARALRMFGRDGMHSLYGLWLVDGGAPVVYVSGEGVGTNVVAGSLDDFVVLLAAGKEAIGWVDQWSDGECEGVDDYRAWLRDTLGREAPDDAHELVDAGRAGAPAFAKWIEEHRA